MHKSKVAIFAALADEIRIVKSKVQVDESVFVRPSRIMRGEYNQHPILLVRTGVGRLAMMRAVEYCISQYRPKLCINVGYCGGTVPDFSVGDLLVANRVADEQTETELPTSSELTKKIFELCMAKNMRCKTGGIVTADRVVNAPHEKAYLGTKFDVLGVDMESYEFVKACKGKEVEMAVVRSVLDPMDMRLPSLEGAVDDEGETDVVGTVKSIIKKPKDILSLPRIEYCAIQARNSISKFIDEWFRQ